MKPASKARLVVGFPRAGPTCFAITVHVEQRAWVGCWVDCQAACSSGTGSKLRSFFQTAQVMRTSLLASATAALL